MIDTVMVVSVDEVGVAHYTVVETIPGMVETYKTYQGAAWFACDDVRRIRFLWRRSLRVERDPDCMACIAAGLR